MQLREVKLHLRTLRHTENIPEETKHIQGTCTTHDKVAYLFYDIIMSFIEKNMVKMNLQESQHFFSLTSFTKQRKRARCPSSLLYLHTAQKAGFLAEDYFLHGKSP